MNGQVERTEDSRYVRFQVSSKHLQLASAHFQKMLNGSWLEGNTLRQQGTVEIPVIACDPNTLLILLNVIHGHIRSVPRSATVKKLTELAILVDYYQCHEVIEMLSDMWIGDLHRYVPRRSMEDVAQWLWISWVFQKDDIFKEKTWIAQSESDTAFRSFGLPIPDPIIGEDNRWRS
jgi:hypothetical protein